MSWRRRGIPKPASIRPPLVCDLRFPTIAVRSWVLGLLSTQRDKHEEGSRGVLGGRSASGWELSIRAPVKSSTSGPRRKERGGGDGARDQDEDEEEAANSTPTATCCGMSASAFRSASPATSVRGLHGCAHVLLDVLLVAAIGLGGGGGGGADVLPVDILVSEHQELVVDTRGHELHILPSYRRPVPPIRGGQIAGGRNNVRGRDHGCCTCAAVRRIVRKREEGEEMGDAI